VKIRFLYISIAFLFQATFCIGQFTITDKIEHTFYSLEKALIQPDSVYELYLNQKGYKKFPTSIFKFRNLVVLDLSNNSIDEIPVEIATLKRLNTLNVSHNIIEVLPDELFTNLLLSQIDANFNKIKNIPISIANAKALNYLSLSNNDIIIVPWDFLPKKLNALFLSENNISEINFSIGRTSQIKELDLSSNQLENIDLKGFLLLNSLYVNSNCKLRYIKGIESTSFETLFATGCDIDDISNIDGSKSLRDLNLTNNGLKTIEGLTTRFPKLDTLTALNNSISTVPDEVINHSRLRYLDLSINPNLKSFPEVTDKSSLLVLKLSGCNINVWTSTPKNTITQNRLESLDLSTNEISELSEYFFYNNGNLKSLNLRNNNISNLEYSIGNYQLLFLNNLYISNNKIEKIDFGRFPFLLTVDLSFNRLLYYPLKELKYVTNAFLSNNKIKQEFDSVSANQGLFVLDISNNDIEKIPDILPPYLYSFSIANNSIEELSEKLGLAKNLATLIIGNNPIKKLPKINPDSVNKTYLQAYKYYQELIKTEFTHDSTKKAIIQSKDELIKRNKIIEDSNKAITEQTNIITKIRSDFRLMIIAMILIAIVLLLTIYLGYLAIRRLRIITEKNAIISENQIRKHRVKTLQGLLHELRNMGGSVKNSSITLKNTIIKEEGNTSNINNYEEIVKHILNIYNTNKGLENWLVSYKYIEEVQKNVSKTKASFKVSFNHFITKYKFMTNGISIEEPTGNIDAIYLTFHGEILKIIEELLDNSIDHAFPAKQHDKKVNISVNEVNDFLQICFKDNGKGIEPEIHKRILKDLKSEKRIKENQTGFSRIQKIICENLRGNLEIRNNNQVGLEVIIIFPLN